MDGTNAKIVHEMREILMERTATSTEHMRDYGVEADPQSWVDIWRKILTYAQQGNRGEAAKENAPIGEIITEETIRESYPTLYPGEVRGETTNDKDTGRRRRDLQVLTNRARNNQHKQKRREETHKEKRIRSTKEEA
eukprot:1063965-Pleurochrysis_carterae.AAC.1